MTVLSKLSPLDHRHCPGTSRSNHRDSAVAFVFKSNSMEHVEVETEGTAGPCGFETKDTINSTTCACIPCVSAYAAWMLGEMFAASSSELQIRSSDACRAVGPWDDFQKMYPTSCLISFRKILIEWLIARNLDTLPFIDWDAIRENCTARAVKTLVKRTAVAQDVKTGAYDAIQPVQASRRAWQPLVECVVCCCHPAGWRWSNCFHSHENGALICLC